MNAEKPAMNTQVAQAFVLMSNPQEHFRVGTKKAHCPG